MAEADGLRRGRPFTILARREAWSCPWFAVRQDEIRLPDGRLTTYNVIHKEPAVWIVPVTPGGEVVLIENYRYTVDDWCLEVPAGGLKPGQSLEAAARAELREEVGGEAAALEYRARFYPANGICDEVGHVFLAAGVTLGAPEHEPTEVMEVRPMPVAEALRLAHNGEIADGPSALALLLCEERLWELAREAAGGRAAGSQAAGIQSAGGQAAGSDAEHRAGVETPG
jgi:ADP-ribose pyrophosphatase